MRIKLLTFRYSATLGGFDDTALVDFTRDKEVIAFREHFYAVNETPHLTCIVHYQDAVVPQAALEYARQAAPSASSSPAAARAAPPTFRRRDGRPDPCAGLDEAGRALFNHFREWRSKQAHDDGVPPYLVLTDKQVLELLAQQHDRERGGDARRQQRDAAAGEFLEPGSLRGHERGADRYVDQPRRQSGGHRGEQRARHDRMWM